MADADDLYEMDYMPKPYALDRIYVAMDGNEWDSDLWDKVADIMLSAGYPAFRSPEEDE